MKYEVEKMIDIVGFMKYMDKINYWVWPQHFKLNIIPQEKRNFIQTQYK